MAIMDQLTRKQKEAIYNEHRLYLEQKELGKQFLLLEKREKRLQEDKAIIQAFHSCPICSTQFEDIYPESINLGMTDFDEGEYYITLPVWWWHCPKCEKNWYVSQELGEEWMHNT